MSTPSKIGALFIGVTLLALFIAGCAGMQTVAVPENLQPAPNEWLSAIVPARGVQIYECRELKDRPGEYDWAFIAPQADLFDASGAKKIGHHYAGPHWESADGSRIVGSVKQGAPAPNDGAISWLLLTAKSVGPEGSFSKVTSVQRVRTVGGSAPKGCFSAEAGMQLRIGYTADYVFFAPKPSRDFDAVPVAPKPSRDFDAVPEYWE